MHEIITLQFGQQANYLGTHYWNVQESYFTYDGQDESPVDHDVSFRAGIGADGHDTYTPRALIYDLKGAFGTLRRENALYRSQQNQRPNSLSRWNGPTETLQLQPITPSPYQLALDQGTELPHLTTDSVRFWSDYNHVFYHPRSIVQLHDYELNSSLMPFERWRTGEELFDSLNRQHDLLDRDLRLFLEDSDQLQGLQVFTSIDDAWGGFVSKYLETIADEMGKGCRWVFGLRDGRQLGRERTVLQTVNAARSLHVLNTSASVQIPMTSLPGHLPRYLAIDGTSYWHTAALQVASLETLTLSSRLQSAEHSHALLNDLEMTLNSDGNRNVAAISFSAEDPAELKAKTERYGNHDTRMTNGVAQDEVPENSPKLDVDLFPEVGISRSNGRASSRSSRLFSCVEMLRGAWKSEDELVADHISALNRSNDGLRTISRQSQLLFPQLPSYPRIFTFGSRPQKIAIKAAISTSSAVAAGIRSLERAARMMVGVEEREALSDRLATMAAEYEEGWSDENDFDEDD